MPAQLPITIPPIASGRNDALNDTGRTAFCGPYVVSAITGYPISKIEDEIRAFRALPEGAQAAVKGTSTDDVAAALRHYGFNMLQVANYMHLARKERPSLWAWMQRPRNAWAHYILAIHKGKEGHWVLVKGVKLCDTYSQGKWEFVCDGPHKGAKIMEIFEVKRAITL
jgi:hypothetical protein